MSLTRFRGALTVTFVALVIGGVIVASSASSHAATAKRSGVFLAGEAGTVAVIVGSIVAAGILFWSGLANVKDKEKRRKRARQRASMPWWKLLLRQLLIPLYCIAAVLFSYLFATYVFHAGHHVRSSSATGRTGSGASSSTGLPKGPAHPAAPWVSILIATLVVLALGAAAFYLWHRLKRSERGADQALEGPPRGPVASFAIRPTSIESLRADPDPRRAVVSAYVGMEKLLGLSGERRGESELPRRYLARRLGADDTLRRPALRLAELFEWARYSDHSVHPRQRDEAVELLGVVSTEVGDRT